MEPIVLVVDPNPGIGRRVDEALAGTDYRVVTVRSAEDAGKRTEEGGIAIALVSVSLPGVSGYDLCRSIGEAHPAAFLVLMTGGFEVFNPAKARHAGASGHLVKPFSPGTLRQYLAHELGDLSDSARDFGSSEADQETEPAKGTAWPSVDVPPPPLASQRYATLVPRGGPPPAGSLPDIEVLRPEIERLVVELLPEIVQAVLRHEMVHSPRTREMVESAIESVLARKKD